MNNITLEQILNVYRSRGQAQYGGEAVSQLEHALQCATFAADDGQSPELITACFLHDLGHLVHHLGDNPRANAYSMKQDTE